MTQGRIVKLVRGNAALRLYQMSQSAEIAGIADGSWRDNGDSVEFDLVVRGTWNAAARAMDLVQSWLSQAGYNDYYRSSDPVYLYAKSCDRLEATAELGATWRAKQVFDGSVRWGKWIEGPNGVMAHLQVQLQTEAMWLRCAAAPVAETTSSVEIFNGYAQDARGRGGLTSGVIVAPGAALHVRRQTWTSNTGLTARYLWRRGVVNNQILSFLAVGSNFRAWNNASTNTLHISDNASNAASCQFVPLTDVVYDLVFRWSSNSLAVFVDGVKAAEWTGTVNWPASPERYQIISVHSASAAQCLLSVQVWPAALTDDEVASLYGWGWPDCELACAVTPTDGAGPTLCANRDAQWRLYHLPGGVGCRLSVIAQASADWDALEIGCKAGGTPATGVTTRFECESGTLGAQTASVGDSNASGGAVARFTPADTNWAVRTTMTLSATAADLYRYRGRWVLMLNAMDNASTVQRNWVRWKLYLAGQLIASSAEEYSLPAVGERMLISLGELQWPTPALAEAMLRSAGTQYGSAYLTLALEARNTVGSGGGTLDLDALYLLPADLSVRLQAPSWAASTQYLLADFTGATPTTALIFNQYRAQEWAGPAWWEGDTLTLPSSNLADDGALLRFFGLRTTGRRMHPLDSLFVYLLARPAWGGV